MKSVPSWGLFFCLLAGCQLVGPDPEPVYHFSLLDPDGSLVARGTMHLSFHRYPYDFEVAPPGVTGEWAFSDSYGQHGYSSLLQGSGELLGDFYSEAIYLRFTPDEAASGIYICGQYADEYSTWDEEGRLGDFTGYWGYFTETGPVQAGKLAVIRDYNGFRAASVDSLLGAPVQCPHNL